MPGLPAGGRLRILVIDDHRDATTSLAMLLELHGHEVRAAYDGAEGLRLADGFDPHLVVLDIGMPGRDGYEIAGALRARATSRPVVLVALTGYGQKSDLERAMQNGFDHHITKPLDFADLEAILAGLTP